MSMGTGMGTARSMRTKVSELTYLETRNGTFLEVCGNGRNGTLLSVEAWLCSRSMTIVAARTVIKEDSCNYNLV